MILGLSTPAFTLLHVLLSLVGIGSGAIVLAKMIAGRKLDSWKSWNTAFLVTTIATSATGFPFPGPGLDPAKVVGVISLIALAIALFALYRSHLAGPWRLAYIVSAVFAFYLNVFVAVAQAFQKIPALHALAPTQAEPPFLVAQTVVLVAFVVLGYLATRRFPRALRLVHGA
jgi:hypothetical protein